MTKPALQFPTAKKDQGLDNTNPQQPPTASITGPKVSFLVELYCCHFQNQAIRVKFAKTGVEASRTQATESYSE